MPSTSLVRGLLAALVLSTGLARADDPPADLLSHVKVGQRWTFRFSAGELTHEEEWVVAQVNADHVVYLQNSRTRKGDQVLIEQAATEPTTWTMGSRPVMDAAAQALGNMKQTRQALEVPGLKLDCLVTTLQGDTYHWVAIKGDYETFPGSVKIGGKKDGDSRALVKVEQGPAPTMPERRPQEAVEEGSNLPKGALDHVKVGQRWVFVIDNGDMKAELTWTVTAVEADKGRVVYRTKMVTTVEGTSITTDEAEDQEWLGGGSPVMDPGVKVAGITTERKKLEVPGAKLDAYVLVTQMGEDARTEVWTAVRGDHEVFPGPVKQLVGRFGQQLVKVEGP